ncbi:hypothetical protein ACFQZV_13165 [Microbacterium koreense]|uniref:Uncharacterized protein n=1 Tax=Microbacterium koreense TaxID=323761 RepID=A0ABW2ZUF5_9MICO
MTPPAAPRCTSVRFIGYALPTAPSTMVDIGDPNGSGSLAGTYRADADAHADVSGRVAVMANAVRTARAQLPADEEGVLNVFVAPEFAWHSPQGPYLFTPDAADPADDALAQLAAAVPADEYPNWVFVFGSMITSQVADTKEIFDRNSTKVRNKIVRDLGEAYLQAYGNIAFQTLAMLDDFIQWCHAYPIVEIRNRALIVSGTALDSPVAKLGTHTATTEKYFDSAEDFLLWDVTERQDVVTEQMTTYPHIDLSAGDMKHSATDQYAILRRTDGDGDHTDIAVEICLDHSDNRMRRNIDHNPWPEAGDGIDLHLIPSCGMNLDLPSIAARAGGYAFNVDGQYTVGDATTGAGVVSRSECVYANHTAASDGRYQAHSQLAKIIAPAVGGDWRAPSSSNAVLSPLPADLVTVVPVPELPEHGALYAGGPGELHIYGLTNPLPLPKESR